MLHTTSIEEEHPILGPALPHTKQDKPAPRPRMERMRHLNNSIPNIGIRRS